jgi:ubiquinone/menaquinone biosynthesis C-methylase UbiE
MESFNAAAESYDNSRREERAEAIANELRSLLTGNREKDAIEYGCGTGLVGLRLAGEFRSLLLVDYSAGMLRQAERKITQLGLTKVSTLCGDFLKDVPDGLQADCIFTSMALHHIQDTEGIFRVFFNILRPGGLLLAVDINRGGDDFHAKYPDFNGHDGFSQSELIALAGAVGFRGAEARTFFTGNKEANGEMISYSLFCMKAGK